MLRLIFCLTALFCLPCLAIPQKPCPEKEKAKSTPKAVPNPPKPTEVTVPAGKFVDLETLETLASDRAKRGQTIQLRVRSDVRQDGIVVIRSGAPAYGYVVETGNNFSYNEPAYIIVVADRVQAVNGEYLKLQGKPESITGENPNTIVKMEPMYLMTASTLNIETIKIQ